MIIKDTMILIHLAKCSLLSTSCDFFMDVLIPVAIYSEIMIGKEKGYADAVIIEEHIKEKKIKIKKIKEDILIHRANNFNIFGGEAEAVALYWQEKADYLATDDDNVRKKAFLLEISLIGTPAIILALYKRKMFTKEKFMDSVSQLRKIGWFSNSVLDKMIMEA